MEVSAKSTRVTHCSGTPYRCLLHQRRVKTTQNEETEYGQVLCSREQLRTVKANKNEENFGALSHSEIPYQFRTAGAHGHCSLPSDQCPLSEVDLIGSRFTKSQVWASE